MTRVTLNNLTRTFDEVTAVDRINLTVESGEMIALLGPSGCGKTTTLRMVTGLLEPSSGEIMFDGQRVNDIQTENRGAVMVFQKHLLFPTMNIAGNVGFGLKMANLPQAEIDKRVSEMLALVKLPGFEKRRPHQLSGGQQQRIALARALIVRPKLLLLDEPLANLDANLRLEMRELIRDVQQELKTTTIFVTHDQEEAVMLADRIALMLDGRLQQYDQPRTFYEQPASRAVARFFRNENFLEGKKEDGQIVTHVGDFTLDTGIKKLGDGMIWMTVRPEEIELIPSETNNCVKATVIDHLYLGTHSQVILDLNGSRWQAQGAASFVARAGDEIDVRFPPEAIWILDA